MGRGIAVIGRAEHELTIPLGLVVEDVVGDKWVMLGWMRNTRGRFPYFVKSVEDRPLGCAAPFTYIATQTDTLIRKFPALAGCRRDG